MKTQDSTHNFRAGLITAMVRNLLDALSAARSVEHVALVTGLKHYLGPFEAYGRGVLPATPFREEQGRLDIENFYYAHEVIAEWNRGKYPPSLPPSSRVSLQ